MEDTHAPAAALYEMFGYVINATLDGEQPDELPRMWREALQEHATNFGEAGPFYYSFLASVGRVRREAKPMQDHEFFALEVADGAPAYAQHAGRYMTAAMNSDVEMAAGLWMEVRPEWLPEFIPWLTSATWREAVRTAQVYADAGGPRWD